MEIFVSKKTAQVEKNNSIDSDKDRSVTKVKFQRFRGKMWSKFGNRGGGGDETGQEQMWGSRDKLRLVWHKGGITEM